MKRSTAAAISAFLLVIPGSTLALADSVDETEKVVPSGTVSNDTAGWSVSMDGDTMAIGSPYDNTSNGGDSGSVTIIDGDGVEHLLTASNGGIFDFLGYSVDLSGDLVIAGAPIHPIATREGAAYIFRRMGDGTWVQEAELVAPNGQWTDFFGSSVAISGTTAVVGAFLSDVEGPSSGAAWVFEYDGCCSWDLVQQLVPSSPTVKLGASVALAGDRILVGSPRDNVDAISAGGAYVFRLESGTWVEEQRLTGSDTSSMDYFGFSVDLDADGDLAVIGAIYNDTAAYNAGAAYVFKRNGTDWVQQERLVPSSDDAWQKFGSSVSIDGSRAAIGCYGYPDSPGHGYLYEETDNDNWVEVVRFETSDGDNGARVGYAAALSNNKVLLGAPWQDDEAGACYLYDLDRSLTECDLNFDGEVDILDLLVVLHDWGNCPETPAPCNGDVDRNERVDIHDLLAILGAMN